MSSPLFRPRLLIADDHRAVTEGLVRLLGKRYEVVDTIHDGRFVVAAICRHKPDVTLLDLSMPNVNGFDVLRQLEARRANIKVIILTMFAEPDLAVEALELGALGFVSKRKSAKELLTALDVVLRGGTYLALDLDLRAAAAGGSERTA